MDMDRSTIVYLMAEMYQAGQNNILGQPTYVVAGVQGETAEMAAMGKDQSVLRKDALLLVDEWEGYRASSWIAMQKDADHYSSDEIFVKIPGGTVHGSVVHFLRQVEVARQFRKLLTETAAAQYQCWVAAVEDVVLGELDCEIEQFNPALLPHR